MPGNERVAQIGEQVDEMAVRLRRQLDRPRHDDWDEVRNFVSVDTITSVHQRMVALGEATDRRCGYLLTAGAFVVTFGSFSAQGSAADSVQSTLVAAAALLGALALLSALRATTRRVGLTTALA